MLLEKINPPTTRRNLFRNQPINPHVFKCPSSAKKGSPVWVSREKVRHFSTTARFFSSKRRRLHFAAHGQWTRSWTFLMGINERGINETINDTIV